MQNVDGCKYGCNSAIGLRDISNSIVNVEVRDLAIDSTRGDELTELCDEGFEAVALDGMLGNRFLVVVLVVADDVG